MNSFQNNDFDDIAERQRQIRLERIKRQKLAQQKRDRQQAIAFLVIVGLVIVGVIGFIIKHNIKTHSVKNVSESTVSVDTSSNDTGDEASVQQADNNSITTKKHKVEEIDGVTYVDGIIIANKTYSLPEDYDPGLDEDTLSAFQDMIAAASRDGLRIYLCSGYRSYKDQEIVYNGYAEERGTEAADEVSARPGHSEHQTGLAIDVNYTEFSFADTNEGQWLADHCAEYGFIIRFPKGKEEQTGFEYEPWHIRYVGVDIAKEIMDNGLCLEEYLGVTSKYEE